MTADMAAGLAAVGGMVAYPFVEAWVQRARHDRRRRVARMVAAAERDGRVAK